MTQSIGFSVNYKFWPVGQGLFASGNLRRYDNAKCFHWIYDCGTSSKPSAVKSAVGTASKQTLIKSVISSYQAEYFAQAGSPKIDLIAISHFDTDHVSGLVELLSKFSVGTLLLPYMPLWQRLLVAFANGVDPQQSAMRFFVNPAKFVSDAAKDRAIDQIVFVTAGGEGPPVSDAGEQNQNPDGLLLVSQYRSGDQLDDEQRSLVGEYTPSGKNTYPEVKFLADEASIVVGGVWEFVPYNDASIKIKISVAGISAFQKRVAQCRDKLLAVRNKETLKELKNLYDERFGSSGVARNMISLFVYAGPTRHRAMSEYWFDRMIFRCSGEDGRRVWLHRSTRSSVLYTGDGYLDSPERFEALKKYLTPERIAKISCLQVMHHGAKANWFQGLARKLSPDISVFSSNPDHKGFNHPHGCVVRDFLMYTPVQVDKVLGWEIHIDSFR